MIDKTFAAVQVQRMIGLNFFPTDSAGQKELIRVSQEADTQELLASVISKWLDSSTDRPTPYDLRHAISEANMGHRERQRKCPSCDGMGVTTIWMLVTYAGQGGFKIDRSERVPDVFNQEQANDAIRRLMAWHEANAGNPRQTIVSAAKRCECRAAA